jgi:Na+-exporting ATPase
MVEYDYKVMEMKKRNKERKKKKFHSTPPALGLGVEGADKNLMMQPPPIKNRLISKEIVMDTLAYGITMGGLSLGSFLFVLHVFYGGIVGENCNEVSEFSLNCDPVYRARSTAFLTMSILIMLLAIECKHFRKPIWRLKHWKNKILFWTFILGIFLTVPTLYIPVINTKVFKHVGITIEWAVVVVALAIFLVVAEIYKFIKRLTMKKLEKRK